MGGSSVAMVAAVLLSAGSTFADQSGGVSVEEWLRTGGAVLELQVTPASARVELDGDRLHPGPILVTPGIHLLVARATGRRELREVIQVPSGRRTKRRIELASMPVTGRLDLRLFPRGARVLVDGHLVAGPLRVLTLTAGRHRVVIAATGYRTERRVVRVPRAATLTLRIDLSPERRRRHRRPRVA
jgi:hypothetical protein